MLPGQFMTYDQDFKGHITEDDTMSTAEKLETNQDYKVADIALADWGRKELEIAEGEMPALMALPFTCWRWWA